MYNLVFLMSTKMSAFDFKYFESWVRIISGMRQSDVCHVLSLSFECMCVFVGGGWHPNIVFHICIMYGSVLQLAENAYTKWFIRSAAFLVEPTAMDGNEQESESQISSPKVTIAHIRCNIAEQNQAKHWTATEAFSGTVIFIRIMLSSFGSMSVI